MSLTRSGVAYNLEESPHRLDVPYDSGTITYVFSSDLYRRNFYDRFLENREQINESLTRRFGFPVNNDVLCDVRLYKSIEKRGFLLMKGEERILWQDITLDGGKLTKKS
jgi:hypothetical protein